jgi:hypothetical protein
MDIFEYSRNSSIQQYAYFTQLLRLEKDMLVQSDRSEIFFSAA